MTTYSSGSDQWASFEAILQQVRWYKLDLVKSIITGLNAECGARIHKTGRKQDLIDRIHVWLKSLKSNQDTERWRKATNIINRGNSHGGYPYTPSHSLPTSTYIPSPPSTSKMYTSQIPASTVKNDPYGIKHSYAPSYNLGPPPSHPSTTAMSASGPSKSTINFKPSPFLRVETLISEVIEGPESNSGTDRRSAAVNFSLSPDHVAKLTSNTAKYQLRLYCTSSTYYVKNTYRTSSELCPIEFPPTCEIRLNGTTLNVNTKGLKKSAGTAPPADLGRSVKHNGPNRVEMVYVNNTQNQGSIASKKYYMVVILSEVTTVDQLVDRLKKGKRRDAASIIETMKKKAEDDDDEIVAGPQKMTLRDPLTMVRVATPARSVQCVHPACFDATTWFMVMEGTTTWKCPICDTVLNPNELFVDGYFESIVQATPEDYDDVMVEADGEWHTADNKFASPGWAKLHPPKAEPVVVKKRTPSPKPGPANVFVLDDSDDDESQVKRELSPTFRRGGTNSSISSLASIPPASPMSNTPIPATRKPAKVIDLTLDSDDDDVPVVAPPPRTSSQSTSTGTVAAHFNTSVPPSAGPPHATHDPGSSPISGYVTANTSFARPEKRKAPDERISVDPTWKRSRADNVDPYMNGYAPHSSPPHSSPHGMSPPNYDSHYSPVPYTAMRNNGYNTPISSFPTNGHLPADGHSSRYPSHSGN